jgi:hypothetical protein
MMNRKSGSAIRSMGRIGGEARYVDGLLPVNPISHAAMMCPQPIALSYHSRGAALVQRNGTLNLKMSRDEDQLERRIANAAVSDLRTTCYQNPGGHDILLR